MAEPASRGPTPRSGGEGVGAAEGGGALGVGGDPGAGVVGDGDVVGVNPVVAGPADEHGVLHGGRPARRPGDEVVDLADPWGGVAAGAAAGPVSGDHGAALGGGDDPLGPADVQRLAVGSEDDPGGLAVAGDPVQHGAGDGLPGLGEGRGVDAGVSGGGGQGLEADGDVEVRADL